MYTPIKKFCGSGTKKNVYQCANLNLKYYTQYDMAIPKGKKKKKEYGTIILTKKVRKFLSRMIELKYSESTKFKKHRYRYS